MNPEYENNVDSEMSQNIQDSDWRNSPSSNNENPADGNRKTISAPQSRTTNEPSLPVQQPTNQIDSESLQNLIQELLRENISSNEKETPQININDFLANFQKPQDSNNFNPAEATDRIGAVEGINSFDLYDFDGNPIQYGKDEEYNGNIKVLEGMQVSKLDPHKTDENLTHVIFWYREKYREGYIETKSMETDTSTDNIYATDVFINDAEHILFRAKERTKRFETEKKEWAGGAWLNSQFNILIQEVEQYINNYKSGTLNVNNDILKEIKDEDNDLLKRSEEDPFSGTQEVQSKISTAYDPQDSNGNKFSEETLMLPLSKKWFYSHPKLQAFAENQYRKSTAPLDNSSQVIKGGRLEKLKETLFELKNYISNEDIPKSKETDWLENLKESDFKKILRVIIIGAEKWEEKEQNEKYSSFVAKENSIGPLRAHSAMTIATHEMNMGGIKPPDYAFLPGDSHSSTDETEKYWSLANEGKFGEVQSAFDARGHMGIDSLFQIHSGLALIYLKHCFQRIESKN